MMPFIQPWRYDDDQGASPLKPEATSKEAEHAPHGLTRNISSNAIGTFPVNAVRLRLARLSAHIKACCRPNYFMRIFMAIRIQAVLAVLVVLISGCATAPQQPVQFAREASGPTAGRIGVVMTALPKQDTQVPGAGCLLCLAFASSANSALTKHAQTLSYEDLPKLKNEIAGLLRKNGTDVAVIEENLRMDELSDYGTKGPNIARKDFSPLRAKYHVDKLLVIDITAIGFIRTYSAYIPTSDPKGLLQGTGYLVNLGSNTFEWYQPVSITKSADQNWDEPPKFPGLTNAYFQAIELGKEAFLKPLAEAGITKAAAGAFSSVTADARSTARVAQ